MTGQKKLASIYFFLTISLILVNTTTIANAQYLENTGKIHGQVTLKSGPLANQTVSLNKLQNNTLIPIVNATTDNNGNYTFENLVLEETYLVSLVFQGVPYSKKVNFENQTSVQIDFTVYETTTSDAHMKIHLIHFIINLEEGHLRILEDAVYINVGLQVFNNSRLKAWLPSDIYGFKTSIMDCCIQQFEDRVLFDPMDPIKPNGKYSMRMEYNIEISSSEQLFEKKLAYDTEQLYLIIENKPGVTAEITSGLVNKSRIVPIDDAEYTVFNGTDLKANSTIAVRFTGLPTPQIIEVPIVLWVIIPLILVIGFFTYPIVRKKPSEKKISPQDLETQKLTLFGAIAKLDSEYAAGKISKEKYEKLRSEHKKKAIEIIQQTEKSKVTQLAPSVARTPILKLYAEEQALISTLHKLEVDYEKRLVSAESYRKMKDKFERRRAEVVKKIKELEKTATQR